MACSITGETLDTSDLTPLSSENSFNGTMLWLLEEGFVVQWGKCEEVILFVRVDILTGRETLPWIKKTFLHKLHS